MTEPGAARDDLADIAGQIEYTFLKHDPAPGEFDAFLKKSLAFPFGCIIVPPFQVGRTIAFFKEAGRPEPQVGSVVAFPLGYTPLTIKHREIEELLALGASDIDMVQNIALLRASPDAWREEVWSCAELVRSFRGTFKLILETNLLTPQEKEKAALGAVEAGAHYLKTGTGYFGGAKVEHVAELKRLAASKARIKAAGGIKTPDDFRAMVQAGADRVGTSSGFEILKAMTG